MSKASSISAEEIAQFGRLAPSWWDPSGPMRALHDMNPLRTNWNHQFFKSLARPDGEGISLLDIGCGAGIASETYARLGYQVTGLDASAEAIAAARSHQEISHPETGKGSLNYQQGAAEDFVAQGLTFDAISALEVIEHVTDAEMFLHLLSNLTRPGGLVAISTLNRTLRSLAVAKFGAEYVMRILPVGTHQWRKFIKPSELVRAARGAGLKMIDITGTLYAGAASRLTLDTRINYQAMFRKQ